MRNITPRRRSPVNLLALALLATPRHMALASELQLQLDTLLAVLPWCPTAIGSQSRSSPRPPSSIMACGCG